MSWNYLLPFINMETVWRVYEVNNPGGNESRTLRAIVCYKPGGTVGGKVTVKELMSFPSNVALVTFAASSDVLEFERDTSFASPVPTVGAGSLHTASVAAFGVGYKRFKALITRDAIIDHEQSPYDWTSLVSKHAPRKILSPGPEFDPGTWAIVSGDTYFTLAGVMSVYVSGPSVPTSGNNRVVAEAMIVPTKSNSNPAVYPTQPSKFRAYHTATTPGDPTQHSEYSSNLESNTLHEWVWVFDPITISSSWA